MHPLRWLAGGPLVGRDRGGMEMCELCETRPFDPELEIMCDQCRQNQIWTQQQRERQGQDED